ncbi:MAG: hypothetical protein JO227_00380 [Acetobacteraceae bacterium]|nr:hypothetical protein [Acetobacteraceae bacterium]
MRKLIWLALVAAAVSGCAHNVYIAGRDNGLSGQTTVTAAGQRGGPFNITIGPEHFAGRWVYVKHGGSTSFGTATAFNDASSASALGTGFAVPAEGGGSIIASSPDGNSLRCVFGYNEWSATGMGECKDRHGDSYDLQID